MLNFRNVNIFFATLLVILIAVDILYDLPFLVFIGTAFIYSLIVFYGCYFIDSDFFMKVYCSAKISQKQIAISFDDGPVEVNTPNILEILKLNNVKAVFFCIGNRIAGNESIIKQIVLDGHVIGNHSFSHHFFFDLFSSGKMLRELNATDREIKKITGLKPKLFRPPYGVMNPGLRKAIIEGDYIPVGWSVRSYDTVIKDEQKLLTKITRAIKPGAVFLFHDTSLATISILPQFIRNVKELGFEIVSPDKMLALKPYA